MPQYVELDFTTHLVKCHRIIDHDFDVYVLHADPCSTDLRNIFIFFLQLEYPLLIVLIVLVFVLVIHTYKPLYTGAQNSIAS